MLPSQHSDALRVPVVGNPARARAAACRTIPVLSTALSEDTGAGSSGRVFGGSVVSGRVIGRSLLARGLGFRGLGLGGLGGLTFGGFRSLSFGGLGSLSIGGLRGLGFGSLGLLVAVVAGRRGRRITAAATLPNGGAREGEVLDAIVDAEVGIVVCIGVGAGELDDGSGGTRASVLDLDLDARNVVLGLVDVGPMNTCNVAVSI